MNHHCHLLIVHQIPLFRVAKLPTLKGGMVARLHKHSTDGEVEGIRVYLKREGEVNEL